MKVVINKCYGGFGLSAVAESIYAQESGKDISVYEIPRDDPILVSIVESMGGSCNGTFSELKVIEIPDDVEWQIDEYDGLEWVAEIHRTWS